MKDMKAKNQENDINIVFSKTVKAGRRIYYFDVKKTQKGGFYLSLTESKRTGTGTNRNDLTFEKHKVLMYPEDFEKLKTGLLETMDYIQKNYVPTEDNEEVEEEDHEAHNENILQSGHAGEIKLDIEF